VADKLLIRAYNVGCGDCIYVRIPKARKKGSKVDDFHILIDCGSKAGEAVLESALNLLKPELPLADGKRRLDLVVLSHEHEDHMKGFNPLFFEEIAIENIWLSAAMNREHPQSKIAHAFHQLAETAMRNVAERGVALSPALKEMVGLYSINNKDAVKALTNILPAQNGIEPVYVHSKSKASELKLKTLVGDVVFKILGPDYNIDYYYMGSEAAADLNAFSEAAAGVLGSGRAPAGVQPGNISGLDFRRLRSRMMSSAFAYTAKDSVLINNTSIMLLIEWRGRRLLFVGDAEWEGSFVAGNHNGAWNVAWKKQKAKLDQPLDFLKIGHHGSTNATPWNEKEDGMVTEASTILDAILPFPTGNGPGAKAVVSTARTPYDVIPRSTLLVEIAKRISNAKIYAPLLSTAQIQNLPHYAGFEDALLGEPQPQRTDMEALVTGKPHVDMEFEPVAGH
jgi:beta-lactamase superfamily II metal-dependent hydrolase